MGSVIVECPSRKCKHIFKVNKYPFRKKKCFKCGTHFHLRLAWEMAMHRFKYRLRELKEAD